MKEREIIEALRLRLERPGTTISLGRVLVRETMEALLHQQSIIRRLREELAGGKERDHEYEKGK